MTNLTIEDVNLRMNTLLDNIQIQDDRITQIDRDLYARLRRIEEENDVIRQIFEKQMDEIRIMHVIHRKQQELDEHYQVVDSTLQEHESAIREIYTRLPNIQ